MKNALGLSKAKTEALVAQGEFTRPGQAQPLGYHDLVFPNEDLHYRQKPLRPRPLVYYLFNKPASTTVTTRDPDGRRDLQGWLSQLPPGVMPWGRLDRATSGALILSNDGQLAEATMGVGSLVSKDYRLILRQCLSHHDPRLGRMLTGVESRGELLQASGARITYQGDGVSALQVWLHGGKNRQIRRMCRVLDFYLMHLHRAGLGPIRLGALPVGEFRPLSQLEVGALWQAAGGVAYAQRRRISALRKLLQAGELDAATQTRLKHWLNEYEGQNASSFHTSAG